MQSPDMSPSDAYARFCQDVFGAPVAYGNHWMVWSFARNSPQSARLFAEMRRIEFDLFRDYVAQLTTERREGSVVEFGTGYGHSFEAFADAIEADGGQRELIGYDSFEGLPEPSADDLDCWKKGDYQCGLDRIAERVAAARRPWIRFVPGWFEQTLKEEAGPHPAEIALAHIDCDLYASARDALRFLESRLVDGAYLIFDDWTFHLAKGETKAFAEFQRRVGDVYRFEHLASIGLGAIHFRVWRR